MIYLTTGANGASKTLLTLYDVRQQQLKESRPVYYHGFEAVEAVLEDKFGWRKHEPEKWNLPEDQGGVPDGSILVWDEAQRYLGAKLWGNRPPPTWVGDLGQFRRKRGIDIWITCPHPSFIHVDVRRLVASPSWHRHLKRVFGSEASSQITYDSPNLMCDKHGAGDGHGEMKVRPFPKEVYTWYVSASVHTGKVRIPRAVWFLGIAAILIPLTIWGAVATFKSSYDKRFDAVTKQAAAASPGGPGVAGQVGGPAAAGPKTQREYLADRAPRISGLPYTAPAFDGVTQVAAAPYPAACVEGKRPGEKSSSCKCYTQQGTVLPSPVDLCRQIVANGFFVEWHQASAAPSIRGAAPGAVVPSPDRLQRPLAAPTALPGRSEAPNTSAPPSAGVDLVNNGRDTRPVFFPALVDAPVIVMPTVQEARDTAVLRAMRSGDWARN